MAEQKPDLAQRVVKLRTDVATAQRLRAEAEGTLAVAKQKLEEIDGSLRKLGLDPEKADVELAALERQLDASIAELQQGVSTEIAAYNDILKVSKAALA